MTEEQAIERIVKNDFIRYSVYGGYTDEVKEAEWQRMRRIEIEQFKRRLSAYSATMAETPPSDKEVAAAYDAIVNAARIGLSTYAIHAALVAARRAKAAALSSR